DYLRDLRTHFLDNERDPTFQPDPGDDESESSEAEGRESAAHDRAAGEEAGRGDEARIGVEM
ncbi:MAG: hypothetical protein Q9170_006986, partial [Blastenia crenularia]